MNQHGDQLTDATQAMIDRELQKIREENAQANSQEKQQEAAPAGAEVAQNQNQTEE